MATISGQVSLREITAATVRTITDLKVKPGQQHFVATNAESLAQALFASEAWFRAVYVGDTPAGFVLLEDETLRSPPPADPKIGVWRFMIDARFQGSGVGHAAMSLIIEHVRGKGCFKALHLSYVPGPRCPEPFYRGFGFEPTGEVDDGEIVMALRLD